MKFKNILSLSALAILSLGILVGCEDDAANENNTNKDFVSLAAIPKPVDVPEGDTKTIEAKVYAGHVSNVDRVLSLQVIFDSAYNEAHPGSTVVPVTTADADEFVVPATVTIPAGSKEGVFQVTLTDVDLGYSGKQIVIGIVPEAGVDQIMSSIGSATVGDIEILNKRLVITARRQCLLTQFSVEISTDRYGDETTWELYDGDLNIIASGGPYAQVTGGGQGEKRFLCLEDGNYTFVIYDSEGDGMNDGTVQGFYKLVKYDADGNETEVANGGAFTDNEVVDFVIP